VVIDQSSVRTGNTKKLFEGLHQYYTMEEFEALLNTPDEDKYTPMTDFPNKRYVLEKSLAHESSPGQSRQNETPREQKSAASKSSSSENLDADEEEEELMQMLWDNDPETHFHKLDKFKKDKAQKSQAFIG
jgi:hypothetical protein